MTATFVQVPVDRITPHDRNVRRDLGDLDELSASIKGMGVLQPLIVAPDPGTEDQGSLGYILVAGHRRHAAAVKAGLAKVPCVVRTDLDTQAKVLSCMLVENLQRSDLTVMEEADAYAQLELLGVKEAAIAKTTGRSRATVHQRILLAGLPAERREQYEKGSLSLEGAVKCAKLRERWADDEEIIEAIDEQGTWAFGDGSYGIDRTIERILDSRKPQPEPEEDVEDEGSLDLDGRRAEWESREQERAARQEAGKAAWARMYDWLSARVTEQDRTVMSAMLDLAIDIQVTDYDMRGLPELFGIEPAGEDEDVDDANLRIAADLKALDLDDRTMFLAIASADLASPMGGYYLDSRMRNYQALGYTLTDDDRTFLTEEASA